MASILNRIPTSQSYYIQTLPRQRSSFQSIKQKIQNKVQNEKESTLHKILQNYKRQSQLYATPSKKPSEQLGRSKTTKKEKKLLSMNTQPKIRQNQDQKYSHVSTITIKITSFDSDSDKKKQVQRDPVIYEIQLDQFN